MLEFPFMEVDEAAVAFGGIPNYNQVFRACPPEFFDRVSNQWYRLASKLFLGRITFEELRGFQVKAVSQEEADMKIAYLKTWIESFAPPHHIKMAVCAWLLSLMLEKVPELK